MSKAITLAAFISGAALGAVVALLFAPNKGEDTRTLIADTLREHGVKLNRQDFNDLVSSLEARFRKSSPAEEAEEGEAEEV